MALFNVLAKSKDSIDWSNLLDSYSNLNLTCVEIFPIPKELGFEHDSIGINVHRGYTDKSTVTTELKLAIDFLSSYGLKLTELYGGIEVDTYNIVKVASNLLG